MALRGSTVPDESVSVGAPARTWPALELLAAGGVAALLLRPVLVGPFDGPAAQTWATMFVSLTVQALPFLVLGVVVSGAIAAFVPAGALARVLPRRASVAVPVAGLGGVLVPGCECSSVPVAGRLVAGGAPAPAALAFMLAAPALNPVVLVATAVAFPDRPGVVVARFVASYLTAVVVGLGWARFGRPAWTERPAAVPHPEAPDTIGCGRPEPLPAASHRTPRRRAVFSATARHDFGHAGGFLVLGAATAATLQVVMPRSFLDGLGGSGVAGGHHAGAPGGGAGRVLGGRRLRGGQPGPVLPHGRARLHGGGPGRRRETHRAPSRHLRPGVRHPLRPGHIRGRRGVLRAGRVVVPVTRGGMNEEAQAGIILALGALALRLGLTDAHLAYIQPVMGPVLAAAGAVLAGLGGVVLLRPRARSQEHGHDHGGASRVGWLLVAPVLAIAAVSPSPLGAFAANGAPATLPTPRADFGPLPPPAGGAVDLPITEFVGRAVHDEGRLLGEVPVRLVGFVTADVRGGGFLLTRFVVNCCAADARPVRVAIRGARPPWPAPDTWLEVIGTWRAEPRGAEDDRPPALDMISLRTVPAPANQYLR